MKNNKCGFLKILILTICMVIYLAGCSGGSSTSSGGMSGGGGGGGDDNTPPVEPTFANVQTIFNNNCSGSSCHIGNRESGVRLDSYNNVTGSVGDQYGKKVVQPNDAAGSPLVDKISSNNPEHGVRMPKDGAPLSSDQIDLIKQWINDGAKNN